MCGFSAFICLVYRNIMRELEDMEGFRIGGTVVNNRRYVDDMVILIPKNSCNA